MPPPQTVPVSGPPNPGGPKAHPSLENFLIFSASGTLSQGGGPGPRPLSHSALSWSPHTHLDLKSSSGSCQHPCRTPPVAHTHGSLLPQGFSGPQNFPVGLALNHTPPRPPAFRGGVLGYKPPWTLGGPAPPFQGPASSSTHLSRGPQPQPQTAGQACGSES